MDFFYQDSEPLHDIDSYLNTVCSIDADPETSSGRQFGITLNKFCMVQVLRYFLLYQFLLFFLFFSYKISSKNYSNSSDYHQKAKDLPHRNIE